MRAYENPTLIAAAFGLLSHAASEGRRCPTNGEVRGGHAMFRVLADAGKIKVGVYARNWRVVEIFVGPSAGCVTAPSPDFGAPYKVYGGTPAQIAAQDARRRRERVERAEAKKLRRAEARERWSHQPTTARVCMCCRRTFQSEGLHHRMCNGCRRDPAEVA